MVLFLEVEALRLLDLYAALRADPSNVTNNGVLLKQHAREMLTASLNKSFPREQPWTEKQVSVKFKNVRSEYAEFKWLSAQPGFQADGAGMSEDWWQGVKRLRPKCHAFKGKLPWVFESRMKQIVGDGGPDYSQQPPAKRRQEKEKETGEDGDREPLEQEQQAVEVEAVENTVRAVQVETLATDKVASAPRSCHKRKRDDDDDDDSEDGTQSRYTRDREQEQVSSSATTVLDDSYSRSLARSVEQSSVAAAGMAHGFQDLITLFQEQTAKCQELEQQLTQRNTQTPSLVLAEQRSVLLAIARSLEQSTRATADMAQGYRELVGAFVRGSQRHPAV